MVVLAWTDFTQSRTNEFRGTVRNVELIKHEKNLKGDITLQPVAYAVFLLYKQIPDGSWIRIPGIFTTDESGKITVERFSSGNYKFVETNPGYGYVFDKNELEVDITEYHFIISDDDKDTTVMVNAYNRRKTSGLKIKKTVIGKASSPAASPAAKHDDDEKADEENDILSDENYNLEKEDVFFEENENTDEENEKQNHEINEDKDKLLEISDYVEALPDDDPEKEFLFIVIFKDGDTEDGDYEYSIDGGEKKWLTSGDTISLKHGQIAFFEDLPVGLYYEITEISDPDFTTKSIGNTGSIKLEEISMAEFINIHGKPVGKGKVDIIVKKIVEGEIPDSEMDRAFKFFIKKNDNEPTPFLLKAGEIKTFQFDYGDTYSITEDNPFNLGYIQTSVVNGTGTACNPEITVIYTNTYIGLKWKTINGEKTWNLSGFSGDKLPDSIIIELLAKGTVVDTTIVKPDEEGKWFYNFIAPKYDADDKEIEYTIREVPVPGFISTMTGTDIKNTWVGSVTSAPAEVQKTVKGNAPSTAEKYHFTLKALYEAPLPSGAVEETISIVGEGKANFGDITFLNVGTYYYEISEKPGSATNCEYDKTIYTMSVVVEEDGGKLVIRSTDYTKSDSTDTYSIAAFTNNYRSGGTGKPDPPKPGEKVNLSIKKIWAGDQNPEQPQSVTVQLFKDGKAQGTPVTLNKDNNWRYTWIGLDKGPVWTVDETVVPAGYKKSVTGNASSGFLITNTWLKPTDIPPEKIEKVTVRGQKTWNHGNNPIGSRPKGIVIYIKDGNRIAASAMITDTDHWQWCFILPKFRADGSAANYTVDEDPIPNYSKEINGYNLTNTYKPGSDSSTKPGTDEPGQNGDGSSNGKPPADGHNSPKTGDSSNLLIWLIILLISTGALILILYATRRGRRSDN
jgi:pilin isopeptide linkage protein/LPXTG-motif cell wall-anchored protein